MLSKILGTEIYIINVQYAEAVSHAYSLIGSLKFIK